MNFDDVITVEAAYIDPITYQEQADTHSASIAELLEDGAGQLLKGDALVVYAEALKAIESLLYTSPAAALAVCQQAHNQVQTTAQLLGDEELYEVADLLGIYEETIQKY